MTRAPLIQQIRMQRRLSFLLAGSPTPAQWREIYRLRAEAREQFARSRGWTLAQTSFSIDQLVAGRSGRHLPTDYDRHSLYPWVDHPEYFRHPRPPYRPAAILTHAYCPAEEVQRWAAEHGLAAEVLAWSWYYPGYASAVLLTRPVPKSNVVIFPTRKQTPRY